MLALAFGDMNIIEVYKAPSAEEFSHRKSSYGLSIHDCPRYTNIWPPLESR